MGSRSIPRSTWEEIRAMYELSSIQSVEQVIATYKNTHPDQQRIPTVGSTRLKIWREKWKKGSREMEVAKRTQELKEEKLIDLFARQGLPREKRVELLVEGATKPDKLIFEGPEGQQICTPVPDYDVRLKYQKEINALLGEYAPTKSEQKVTGNGIGSGGPMDALIGGNIQEMKIALAKCLQRLQAIPASTIDNSPQAIEAEYTEIHNQANTPPATQTPQNGTS